MDKVYIYDYETVSNAFIGVFVNALNKNDIKVFEISNNRNQYNDLITFLEEIIKKKILLVSYNGLKFDNQISQYLLGDSAMLNYIGNTGENFASTIYGIAQTVIERSRNNDYPLFNPKDNPFLECDIMALNNYDNPAKRSSLKWLQYSMDWPNVEDMSTDHSKKHNDKEILQLTKYCINDCLSTRELYFKNQAEIKLRITLSKHFKLSLISHSEPKLAKSIFLKLLSEKLNISAYILKKKQTYRKKIKLSDAILPYIKFKTPILKDTLTMFKQLVLDGENLKGSFAHKVTYRGLEFSFALGGIHGAKKGIYESNANYIIKSFDVTSYYPNLAIRNKWAPAHIDKEAFCEIYEGFFEERKKYSKKDPLNYVYKILLNSTYGLSNEANSFLKDTLFTMQITCNGQLLLVMLMEELCESIPEARPIMINTDGGEIIIPREYEKLYHDICKKWEDLTKLNLEFEVYKKLVIPDCNNYIGIFEGKEISKEDAIKKIKNDFPKPLIKKTKDGRYLHYATKTKGRFEIDKPLHKNKSFRIKRIAYYNYFVHNLPVEKTLEQNKNIYDYCAGTRVTHGWKFFLTCLSNGELDKTSTQKTLRYYMSKQGCKIIKVKGESIIKIEASKSLERLFNKYEEKEFDDYDIDMLFYIRQINKEINNILPPLQFTFNL